MCLLIVNALLPFRVNILHHRPLSRLECFMTKYGNMLKSNQSLKLLILLLICQPSKYEYYSTIDHWLFCHVLFSIYTFLLWRPLFRCQVIVNFNIFVSV